MFHKSQSILPSCGRGSPSTFLAFCADVTATWASVLVAITMGLTLAVALLYVWLISIGARTIHQGSRHLVDRHDRRDLSIFQIGLRYIQRRLTNALSISVPLCSYL
jgi:hypothetical protein